jgi:hypothetical protein
VLLSNKVLVTDTDDITWKRRKCYPYSDIEVRRKQEAYVRTNLSKTCETELTIKSVPLPYRKMVTERLPLSCESEHSSNDTV